MSHYHRIVDKSSCCRFSRYCSPIQHKVIWWLCINGFLFLFFSVWLHFSCRKAFNNDISKCFNVFGFRKCFLSQFMFDLEIFDLNRLLNFSASKAPFQKYSIRRRGYFCYESFSSCIILPWYLFYSVNHSDVLFVFSERHCWILLLSKYDAPKTISFVICYVESFRNTTWLTLTRLSH